MRLWLIEGTQLLQQGSDFLAFYNEKTDEFIPRQVIN